MSETIRSEVTGIIEGFARKAGVQGDLDPAAALHLQGVDSLDMLSVFFKIEERYGIVISQESLERDRWENIDQIVANVGRLVAEKQG